MQVTNTPNAFGYSSPSQKFSSKTESALWDAGLMSPHVSTLTTSSTSWTACGESEPALFTSFRFFFFFFFLGVLFFWNKNPGTAPLHTAGYRTSTQQERFVRGSIDWTVSGPGSQGGGDRIRSVTLQDGTMQRRFRDDGMVAQGIEDHNPAE